MAGGQHLNKATSELPQNYPRDRRARGCQVTARKSANRRWQSRERVMPDKRRLGLPDDSHRSSAYLYQSQGGMYTDGHAQGILMLDLRIVRR